MGQYFGVGFLGKFNVFLVRLDLVYLYYEWG